MATAKRRRTGTAARRRRNPITARAAANPRRRRTTRRRSNPTFMRRTRRRRNASMRGAGSIAKQGVTALIALVATRQLPQMVLGANNTGWIGYGANIASAVATAMVARSVAGEEAYRAALIGGVCYTASRVLTEQLSPIGQYLSLTGIGDAAAATSLGTIEDAYQPYPVNYVDGAPYIPPQLLAAQAAAAAPGVQGMPERYRRYA